MNKFVNLLSGNSHSLETDQCQINKKVHAVKSGSGTYSDVIEAVRQVAQEGI